MTKLARLTNVAERAAAVNEERRQKQLRLQRESWLLFKVYSSEDKMYRPIKLWIEYQKSLKQKTFPRALRDQLDLVFKPPRELEEAWAEFERDRDDKRKELGKEPGDYFDDW